MDTVTLSILSEEKCDLLVAGGGVAGCCAALAAARLGKKVILMDDCGVLGGQATLGMVAPISSICDRNGESFGAFWMKFCRKCAPNVPKWEKRRVIPPPPPSLD